jgi:Mg/Co/Ni transporter MgtE
MHPIDDSAGESGRFAVRDRLTVRALAYLFAENGCTEADVVDAENNVIGRVGIADLLQPRLHDLTEEHHRARTLFGPPSQPPGDRTRAASI